MTAPTVGQKTGAGVDHPLATLTAAEIEAAVALVRADRRLPDGARFAYVGLLEPGKEAVHRFSPGDPVERRVRLVVVGSPRADLTEVVVALHDDRVEVWDEVPDMRPGLLMEESIHVIEAVLHHPEYRAALARRGVHDLDQIQIDPWPAGSFGVAHEEGRRICRCLSYFRESPQDNGYARPIEGILVFVDMGTAEVLEVLDTGVVPLPEEKGSYYPEDQPGLRPALRPLHVVQPEGSTLVVEGNHLTWSKWSLRVSMDPYEGLVLHEVGYAEGDRIRPVLHRAAISEMVVPYGDPGPLHGWKNAFDVGEWGLGRMANTLTLGCDCLGEIIYLDHVFADEQGHARVKERAICLHEEDYGILWKHVDLHQGRTEVRRSRRLVVSSIATVGNYEYGFYWYFYLDGTIQLEVKLSGILSTMATDPADPASADPPFASPLAPGLAAPYHQHLFCARLDVEVDGTQNCVYEVDTEPVPPGPDNPWGNAFAPRVTLLERESDARRVVDPARSRHWRIANRSVTNRLGRPVAYKLVPGSIPTLLASPDSSVGRRAGFAQANLWVTPFRADERRAAGDHPNQHAGGDGLPRWTAADRPLVDTDVVVWHTFGVTHLPRPEDWPVMPVEYTGFSLFPLGFFPANPALDLAPADDGACGAEEGAR
jgi:primary-amine oxidase